MGRGSTKQGNKSCGRVGDKDHRRQEPGQRLQGQAQGRQAAGSPVTTGAGCSLHAEEEELGGGLGQRARRPPGQPPDPPSCLPPATAFSW